MNPNTSTDKLLHHPFASLCESTHLHICTRGFLNMKKKLIIHIPRYLGIKAEKKVDELFGNRGRKKWATETNAQETAPCLLPTSHLYHPHPQNVRPCVSAALQRIFTGTVSSLIPKSQLLTLTYHYNLLNDRKVDKLKARKED